MSKSTTAEANRRQQYDLAWQAHWLYRELFPWYGDAYLEAKSPRPPWHPPAFEPNMREIVARADKEWTELTGLPPLDACNPDTWWKAAIAAGMQGQPVPNVRTLSVRALGEIILNWAMARMAAADLPVLLAGQDGESVAGQGESADNAQAGSGVALRDAWFLQQWEALGTDTYHKPVVIYRKWGYMNQKERAEICPTAPNKIAYEAVVQAIKRARKKRDPQKITKPKRRPHKKT